MCTLPRVVPPKAGPAHDEHPPHDAATLRCPRRGEATDARHAPDRAGILRATFFYRQNATLGGGGLRGYLLRTGVIGHADNSKNKTAAGPHTRRPNKQPTRHNNNNNNNNNQPQTNYFLLPVPRRDGGTSAFSLISDLGGELSNAVVVCRCATRCWKVPS
jgi:hypothetical protein